MNKHRIILSAFRSRELDGQDDAFFESIQALEKDSELAAWFSDQQQFDTAIRNKLRQVQPPAGLKEEILLNKNLPTATQQRPWKKWAAIAATVAAALLTWRMLTQQSPADAIAMRAVNYTEQMPALQFVCFDAKMVARWVNEQPVLRNAHFAPIQATDSMSMIGSSVVQWDGKPVAMICLQNGNRMAMLYLFSAKDFGLPKAEERTVRKGGYISRIGHAGQNNYVLTTKSDRDDVRFQLPF